MRLDVFALFLMILVGSVASSQESRASAVDACGCVGTDDWTKKQKASAECSQFKDPPDLTSADSVNATARGECPAVTSQGTVIKNLKETGSKYFANLSTPFESKTSAELLDYFSCYRFTDNRSDLCHYKNKLAPYIQRAAKVSGFPYATEACMFFQESHFDPHPENEPWNKGNKLTNKGKGYGQFEKGAVDSINAILKQSTASWLKSMNSVQLIAQGQINQLYRKEFGADSVRGELHTNVELLRKRVNDPPKSKKGRQLALGNLIDLEKIFKKAEFKSEDATTKKGISADLDQLKTLFKKETLSQSEEDQMNASFKNLVQKIQTKNLSSDKARTLRTQLDGSMHIMVSNNANYQASKAWDDYWGGAGKGPKTIDAGLACPQVAFMAGEMNKVKLFYQFADDVDSEEDGKSVKLANVFNPHFWANVGLKDINEIGGGDTSIFLSAAYNTGTGHIGSICNHMESLKDCVGSFKSKHGDDHQITKTVEQKVTVTKKVNGKLVKKTIVKTVEKTLPNYKQITHDHMVAIRDCAQRYSFERNESENKNSDGAKYCEKRKCGS